MFDKSEILMPLRVITDMAENFEAKLLVEAGRLKTVRFEDDLPAPAASGLQLDSGHEPAAVALPTHCSRQEEITDVAGSSPGPAKGAPQERSVSVPHE